MIKKEISIKDNDVIFFSLGENCLADGILERNNLKSFSSPFSSGRSNIEYILNFEKENYIDFLNKDFLKYEYLQTGKKVVRNKKYVITENKYHDLSKSGIEFTHHDVINNEEVRQTIKRRYTRLLDLRNVNIIILYHHRKCDETNLNLLMQHFNSLAKIYEDRNNKITIFVMCQKIIKDKSERCIKLYSLNNIHLYEFYTLNEWAGENKDIFWAKPDDDLLRIMIDDMQKEKQNMLSTSI